MTSRLVRLRNLLAANVPSDRSLAHELGVTENTVKFHVRNILEKLHLHNRAQAVGYALRHRLVDPDPDEDQRS